MNPFSSVLALALASASLVAQSLTGTIVDYNSQPVNNVNVILSNGAPLGTTDALGNFTITGLRNRVYTIQIDPHSNFLAAQQFDFTVNGASTLGTVVLQPAMPVSATFVGPTGAGLLGVNMNAYLLDGTKLFTPHDGSDAFGNVTIGVPTNTPVRIRAIPPVGSNLIPFQQEMTVTAPVALGTLTMAQGFAVSGLVVDATVPLGVAGAELVTTDMITGLPVLQLNKLTLADGSFALLLPFGVHQIDVIPPVTNTHAPRQLFGVPVLSATSLGLVKLQQGALLSGTVLGPGGPVANADIDVYTAGNDKLFTVNDNTTAAGTFSVRVPFSPTASYQLRVDPQPATGLVGTRTASFPFAGPTNVGTITLAQGVVLNFTVLDLFSNPVAGANLNLTDPVSGAEQITPGDISDAAGNMAVVAPVGTWNLSIAAPQGSLWQTHTQANFVVAGPQTATFNLQLKTLECNLQGLGILTVPPGGEIFTRFSFFNPGLANVPAVVDGFVQRPDGSVIPWVPPLYLDFFAQFGLSLDFWIPTPPVGPADWGREMRFYVRLRDANTLTLLDQAYVLYVTQG